MKLNLFLLAFVFSAFNSLAQLNEDFSDGDFTSNPVWTGDIADFQVNTQKQLQLNTSIADTSYLTTPSTSLSGSQWTFFVKLSFNPSSSNFARVYLASDNANIQGSLNGYYVQIGSTADNISLYRQDGNSSTLLIDGPASALNFSTNQVSVKVTRDNSGNWELLTDLNGGSSFISIGTHLDATHSSSAFFGVYCRYTVSNSTKFYFDNIKIGNIEVDTVGPKIISHYFNSLYNLKLVFDEPISESSAINKFNYSISPSIGNPLAASFSSSIPNEVELIFSGLEAGMGYTLSVEDVQDLKGNISGEQNWDIYYPDNFDILINEIMADPSPVVGLPDAEYVELYNSTNHRINIKNFYFDGFQLPNYDMPANGYLIMTSTTNEVALSTYGNTIGLSGFSLLNDGTSLVLTNNLGDIIHAVQYSSSWYGNSAKSEGGWSLEQVNQSKPIEGATNWTAANNQIGGTPGYVNSVNESAPDITPPSVLEAIIISDNKVMVSFDEAIYNPLNTSWRPWEIIGLGLTTFNTYDLYSFNNNIQFEFPAIFQNGVEYTMNLVDTIFDCSGNMLLPPLKIKLKKPDQYMKGDLVINEILADPKTNGVDYVEIYNRSAKELSLKGFSLAYLSDDSLEYSGKIALTEAYLNISPSEYLIFSKSGSTVKSQYFTPNPANFYDLVSLPTMNNTEGNIFLLDPDEGVADSLFYNESMYSPLLNSTDGISLERVNYDDPTIEGNWFSAAETVGFGTPGYKNSKFMQGDLTGAQIEIITEIFSPDNDGYQDLLEIGYKLDNESVISKIFIYDSRGRLVKKLVENKLAATEGIVRWDGVNDENQKANIGIYVVYVETYDLQGNVNRYKKTAVLAGKL